LGRWPSRDPIGYVEGASFYEYVRSMPLRRVDPYGLWGQDFHQFMTATLAVNAGMCFPSEVGEWANAPDTDPLRRAGLVGFYEWSVLEGADAAAKWRAMQEWHFPVAPGAGQVERGSEYAARKYKEGIGTEGHKRCNLQVFAEGLHTLQDSWAHQGKPPLNGIGHSRKRKENWRPAIFSHDADNVEFWPADARAAAQATFNAMKEFMDACPCILEGPHQYEKSRCGDAIGSRAFEKWIEVQYPGENVPSVDGYQPPSPAEPSEQGPPTFDTADPRLGPQRVAF